MSAGDTTGDTTSTAGATNPYGVFIHPELQVRLKILIEVSEHDGYCSGDECEYKTHKITHIVALPAEYKHAQVGDYVTKDIVGDQYLREQFEPIQHSGSGYCGNDPRAEEYGLDKHESRITVLSAKVVKIPIVKSSSKR